MNDKRLENLIRTIETEEAPPEGLKQELLERILANKDADALPVLSGIERFLFEKPLRAACVLSPIVSGAIWAVVGKGYLNALSGLIGVR